MLMNDKTDSVTLKQFLWLIDRNLESENEKIQICRQNDWDTYDEIAVGSDLLMPFYDHRVICIQAVDENTIRLDIEW